MQSSKKSARSRQSKSENEDSLSAHFTQHHIRDDDNVHVNGALTEDMNNTTAASHTCTATVAADTGAAGNPTDSASVCSTVDNETVVTSLPSQMACDSLDIQLPSTNCLGSSCPTNPSHVVQLPYAMDTSKQSKKRSKIWGFWKRGRRSAALPKCVEAGEDESASASVDVNGCFSRSGFCGRGSCQSANVPWPASRRRGSPDPESPTPGNVRRLSMGAGSRSFGMQLMSVVPPAPCMQTMTNHGTHVFIDRRLSHNLDIRSDDSSANPVGYPHLHFSQSLSSSSSSSSGISSVPLHQTAPATPDYPSFSVVLPTVHTQVDYMHCLVPDLLQLTNCCFYWGVMDRYEAERLLEGRPEGTFLVRDSAQEEFLFSVSFRRYGRSLHARIEQWNHRFSFDSHDPDVFAAPSVCALVEHYKDPVACMFFEPMLTQPLPRVYAFTLQHLCRAVICSRVKYDDISTLQLPRQLQEYLKYYHYKQRICVRRFEPH